MEHGSTRRGKPDGNRVVGYIRVSTEEQSLGPEAQREALGRWCRANGAELVAVFEEEVSGGAELDRRPGLLAALEALKAHRAGGLLVAKRDRLARDTFAAGMVERLVERQGARVLSADGMGNGEGPEAQLMRGIVDLFAQYERALIRARTRAALAVKKGRRERVGQIPYGSRLAADGVHLERHEGEQAVLVRMRELHGQGLSIRAIAAKLNAEGAPARGRGWHKSTVGTLLQGVAA